ncbi:hypothetical protein ACWC9R_11850 [Streptomyces sp. NPDC001219]
MGRPYWNHRGLQSFSANSPHFLGSRALALSDHHAACRDVGVNRKTGNRWTDARMVKNTTSGDYADAPLGDSERGQQSDLPG